MQRVEVVRQQHGFGRCLAEGEDVTVEIAVDEPLDGLGVAVEQPVRDRDRSIAVARVDGVQRLPGAREVGRGGPERQGEERAQERGGARARARILVRAKLAQADACPPYQPLLADVDPQRFGEHVEGVDAIVVVAPARSRHGSLGGRRRGLRRDDLRDGGCRLVREGGGDEGGEPDRDQGQLLLHASPGAVERVTDPVTKPPCREPRATPSTSVTRAMRLQQPAGGWPRRYRR